MLKQKPTDPLLAAARKHGLKAGREAAFLMWVGNECWEGREALNFEELTGKVHNLVIEFNREEDREFLKRVKKSGETHETGGGK